MPGLMELFSGGSVGEKGGFASMKAPEFYKYVKNIMDQRGTIPPPKSPGEAILYKRAAEYSALQGDFDAADFINGSMAQDMPVNVAQ